MWSTLLSITPHPADQLTLRRGQALALIVLFSCGIVLVFGILAVITTVRLRAYFLVLMLVALAILAGVYLLNRRGRVRLAGTTFLSGLALLIVGAGLADRALFPYLYLLSIVVVGGAAFGSPTTTFRWALVFTPLPFLLFFALTGRWFGTIKMPPSVSGTRTASDLAQQLVTVALYWLVAGTAFLTARLLEQTLGESRSATLEAVRAHEALSVHQQALTEQNRQLEDTRDHLERLVAALVVPLIPIAPGMGLLPLVGPIDAQRMVEVERTTLSMAFERRLRAVIIDLSGSAGLDADSSPAIARLGQALRLIGVVTVVAGLSAATAASLSVSHVSLPPTTATVHDAILYANRLAGIR